MQNCADKTVSHTDENIAVSVFCAAYNQAEYIRDALDGILMQKTDFRFEVIVHDDASTDGTAEIIREYEELYPDVIKPIYQAENQYSKTMGHYWIHNAMIRASKGQYVANCDGDDYWTDPHKLQKQYDFMENHPKCALCGHRCLVLGKKEDQVYIYPEQQQNYSLEDIFMEYDPIVLGPTLFFRKIVISDLPNWEGINAGDVLLILSGAVHGGCHCLPDVMSAYRFQRPDSITATTVLSQEDINEINRKYIRLHNLLNAYFDYRYEQEFQRVIRYHEYHLYKHIGPLEKIQGEEYDEFRERDKRRKEVNKKKDIAALRGNKDYSAWERFHRAIDWSIEQGLL